MSSTFEKLVPFFLALYPHANVERNPELLTVGVVDFGSVRPTGSNTQTMPPYEAAICCPETQQRQLGKKWKNKAL